MEFTRVRMSERSYGAFAMATIFGTQCQTIDTAPTCLTEAEWALIDAATVGVPAARIAACVAHFHPAAGPRLSGTGPFHLDVAPLIALECYALQTEWPAYAASIGQDIPEFPAAATCTADAWIIYAAARLSGSTTEFNTRELYCAAKTPIAVKLRSQKLTAYETLRDFAATPGGPSDFDADITLIIKNIPTSLIEAFPALFVAHCARIAILMAYINTYTHIVCRVVTPPDLTPEMGISLTVSGAAFMVPYIYIFLK